jgi:arylsulfatase/arylsulfatase A
MFRSQGTVAACLISLVATACPAVAAPRPNVILIMTDDQGYPDLGCHGNPIVQTPHLDAMASRSARLPHFYVSPVCTPTRACLMTGRYNYRTRAIDTFRGRAMMEPDEITIAEVLRGAGYATGIFGKWHLGDTHPLRAMDQGFEEALVHRGGGIGQPSDPPGAEGKYTDPVLFRNGRPIALKGYCTDIYFTEGMKWAEGAAAKGRPFFLYLPTNAPHGPYHDVPRDWLEHYRKQKITADAFPKTAGHPVPKNLNADTLARVYAMISNIDDNVGRLFAWLERNKLTGNTLVLFMTDNGPATAGYTAGLRGRKSSVYDGGIRSPFFAHWPGTLRPGVASERIAAHIDLFPTLVEVCGAAPPKGVRLDGQTLWPLWTGAKPTEAADRVLVIQSHRGDAPVRYHNFAVRSQRWKLVCASGFGLEKPPPGEPKLELYDMSTDPFEMKNVAADHPRVVAGLKERYDRWFTDVGRTRPDNYAPPRILLDTRHEDPVVLTRQDWRGAGWAPRDCGHWEVRVAEAGEYEIKLLFAPPPQPARVEVRLGTVEQSQEVAAGARWALFRGLKLAAGTGRLEAALIEGEKRSGVMFVEVARQR